MISLILFLFLPSPLLLFLIRFLCECCPDVHDLSGFITALQWLGFVLSVPCTLFLSLISEKVRSRIQDPTTSRIFYRLQDSKDDLLSPFGIIAENNNEDSKSPQSDNSSHDESELSD